MAEKVKVPWKPIIIGGSVVGGAVLILWLVDRWWGLTPAEREEAKRILEDAKIETAEMQDYVERIHSEGRLPTDSETKVLDAMVNQMKLKEIALPRSFLQELREFYAEAASKWWLVPLTVALLTIELIAGYMAFKFVKEWMNRRKPPPTGGFTCLNCGELFSTQSALKRHMEEKHPPTTVNVAQAQVEFQKLGAWSYGAVAVESGLYGRIDRRWETLSLSELGAIAWGATSAYTLGVAGAVELSLLQMLPLLLLA